MGRMVEALAGWARRTGTSWFGELRREDTPLPQHGPLGTPGEPIYRLRHWPSIPASLHTADVLRLLSLMCNRPVTRSWAVSRGRLDAARWDQLVRVLARQDALDVVDPSGFANRAAANDSRPGIAA